MASKDFVKKLQHLDHKTARWLMRHFYFTFFQLVLLIVFVFMFRNLLNVIDIGYHLPDQTGIEASLHTLNVNSIIIGVLLFLNSFWMLYMLNALQRLGNLIKDVSYNINRLRVDRKK